MNVPPKPPNQADADDFLPQSSTSRALGGGPGPPSHGPECASGRVRSWNGEGGHRSDRRSSNGADPVVGAYPGVTRRDRGRRVRVSHPARSHPLRRKRPGPRKPHSETRDTSRRSGTLHPGLRREYHREPARPPVRISPEPNQQEPAPEGAGSCVIELPPGYGAGIGPVYRKMYRPKSRSLARMIRSPFWSSASATPQKLLPPSSMK
jgi:hypothetical protein